MTACRRIPDPTAFARASLIYAGPLPEWGRLEPAVRATLEDACRAGDALDDALRARLYARLAGDLVAANEVDQGARVFALCHEAAAAARRANAPGALAIALMGTYYAAAMGMRPAAPGGTVPRTQEILDAAEAGEEHEYAAAIRYSRAITLLAIGEPEAFSREVDGLATQAAASRVPEALWLAEALDALRATVHAGSPPRTTRWSAPASRGAARSCRTRPGCTRASASCGMRSRGGWRRSRRSSTPSWTRTRGAPGGGPCAPSPGSPAATSWPPARSSRTCSRRGSLLPSAA